MKHLNFKVVIKSVISILTFSYLLHLAFLYKEDQNFFITMVLLSVIALSELCFRLGKLIRNNSNTR